MSSVHTRSASSIPPLQSSMANQPARPGSAPPPTTGPRLSSPIHPPTPGYVGHSSPSTPGGHVPPYNLTTTANQSLARATGPHASLSGPVTQPVDLFAPQVVPPSNSFATMPNVGTSSNSGLPSVSPMAGATYPVRPSPWQASMAGRQPWVVSLSGTSGGLGGPLHSGGPPVLSTGPPTSMARPTNLTDPSTSQTGFTGPPTSMARPTSLTGPSTAQTGFTGPPASLTRPPSSSSATPTGQMMGSTGQPLMPPIVQPPLAGQGTL